MRFSVLCLYFFRIEAAVARSAAKRDFVLFSQAERVARGGFYRALKMRGDGVVVRSRVFADELENEFAGHTFRGKSADIFRVLQKLQTVGFQEIAAFVERAAKFDEIPVAQFRRETADEFHRFIEKRCELRRIDALIQRDVA